MTCDHLLSYNYLNLLFKHNFHLSTIQYESNRVFIFKPNLFQIECQWSACEKLKQQHIVWIAWFEMLFYVSQTWLLLNSNWWVNVCARKLSVTSSIHFRILLMLKVMAWLTWYFAAASRRWILITGWWYFNFEISSVFFFCHSVLLSFAIHLRGTSHLSEILG